MQAFIYALQESIERPAEQLCLYSEIAPRLFGPCGRICGPRGRINHLVSSSSAAPQQLLSTSSAARQQLLSSS